MDTDEEVIKRTGREVAEIAVEIKGKVGGTERSCESACHRGSMWRR